MKSFFYGFVLISVFFLTGCFETISADAGENQTVKANQHVTLDGSKSSGDADKLLYHWEQTGGTSVKLSGAETVRATFDAPVLNKKEMLTFKLTTKEDGSSSTDSVNIFVEKLVDQIKPVISLKGDKEITVEVGTPFTDPGVIAEDNVDGDISSDVVSKSNIKTAKIGTYTVEYSVTDQAGNQADPVSRIVNVVDTIAPVITLNGANKIEVIQGEKYQELGVSITDNADSTPKLVISGDTVDSSKIDTYKIIYTATDKSGNKASIERVVTVVKDTIPPVITLKGKPKMEVNIGSKFTDPGATAIDNIDGAVTVNSSANETVDTSKCATYTITYTAVDKAGNKAEKKRTVTVKDLTKPVITLNGASKVEVEEGKSYTDLGATAIDNVDGKLSVVTSGQVDTSTPGSYEMTYTATDKAGNSAIAKRVVIVKKLYYTIEVPLDSNCKGHITKSGKDTNGNGKLDKDEVTETSEPVYDDTRERITRKNLREMIISGEDVTSINTCDIIDMSYLVSLNRSSAIEDELTEEEKKHIKEFNQNISGWNVRGVVSMEGMFYKAYAFNQNIDDWDVSKVKNMLGMFAGDIDRTSDIPKLIKSTNFNQPLNNWNVSNVTNMKGMFGGATKFNQNIKNWNVSNVTNMYGMFGFAQVFNKPLNNWDVSSVTRMDGMFGFTNAFNQPLNKWNVSNVINMKAMFVYAKAFSKKDLRGWNVKKVANHDYFIWGAGSEIKEPKWR